MKSNKESYGSNNSTSLFEVRIATPEDRMRIYKSRHDVYAVELSQHSTNQDGILKNEIDDFNVYIVVLAEGVLAGYVSITPPGQPKYSLDSYLPRNDWPFEITGSLYEIRLLTVISEHRGSLFAAALMYAAYRYILAKGGTQIMATGRREVSSIYRRVGLRDYGIEIQSGKVTYLLMGASVVEIQQALHGLGDFIGRLKSTLHWNLNVAFS